MGEVRADLVHAPGERTHFDQRRSVTAFQKRPVCDRGVRALIDLARYDRAT